jgi:hypothetical protein
VATYSYGGETLRWDSSSPKSARLIRVYNASSSPLRVLPCYLVIIDACIFERYPLNRDKREGTQSLSLETVCFVQKKDESISRPNATKSSQTIQQTLALLREESPHYLWPLASWFIK